MEADDTPVGLAGQLSNKDPAVGLQAVVALRRLLAEHREGTERQQAVRAREARG